MLITAQFGAAVWGGAQWGGEDEQESSSSLQISDSLSFSDSIATILYPVPLTQSLSDTLTFSDFLATILTPVPLTALFTDTLVFSDSVIAHLLNPFIMTRLTDTLQFFDLFEDFFSAAAIRQHLVDFYFVYHEALQQNIAKAPMDLGDFLNFGDSIQQELTCASSFSDVLVFSDSTIESLSKNGSPLADSLSFSDSVQTQLIIQLTLNINDSLSFSDNLTQTPSTDFNSYIRRYLNDVV